MAKKDYLKEMRDGAEKWMKLACLAMCLWIVLDILPRLPEALGQRVADKLLGMVGL